ncbi:MAG: TolC family protein, partial [Candidatus Omnitrophota bacterium]
AIIDEVQKSSHDDLQKAKDLKDKGMILGADYYSARVISGDFTRMKNEIARQKTAMTALLNILMGEPVDKTWSLAGTIKEAEAPLQDQQKLMETALANRPDLFSLNARLQAFDSELAREKSTVLPILSAFGDAANDRKKIGESGGNNYTVGVKAQLPLFDPSREGRIKEAKARKDQLEHNVQLLKDAVERDITEETARYDTLRDNMAVLKGMTDDAKEAVSLAVPLYNEGRKSIADLIEVRRAYLQSARVYNKAVMGIWLSEARLLFLTGQLNEDGMKKLAEGAGL